MFLKTTTPNVKAVLLYPQIHRGC